MGFEHSGSSRLRLASIPALKPYLKAAEACGLDCSPLLKLIGIDPQILDDNNRHIPNEAMEKLVSLLVEATGDPCLGLHAARYVEPSSYSVLGYITMSCSSLRAIQAKIPIYEQIVGDMGVTSIHDEGDHVRQQWQCSFSDPIAKRQELEHVLSSWHLYSQNYIGLNPTQSVWFEHSPPDDNKLLSDYAELFGTEVKFNMPMSAIIINKEVLDQHLPQANDMLLQVLLEHATGIMADLDKHQPVSYRVKNILRLILKKHPPTSELIAGKLGMSNRTLQRKLEQEGSSFQEVLRDLRTELALYYLQHTSLNLKTIADELGYSEMRSFHRSFKQWTGRTPGSYR